MAVLGHALDCLTLFLSLNHSWRGQHGAATLVESSATNTKGFPVCRRKEACEDLGAVAFTSECACFPASAPPPCVWLPSCAHTHSHHILSVALHPHLLVLP